MGALDQAPRISVVEVRLFERDVTFRMPFRFGVITATGGPQVYARVRVSAEDGREAWGMAAEMRSLAKTCGPPVTVMTPNRNGMRKLTSRSNRPTSLTLIRGA